MGKTGEERRFQERRAEILRKAADLFRKKGFHGAGMREIAKDLGLKPGALYYYFESKEDLLYFSQTETLERLVGSAREIVALGLTGSEKLGRLMEAHLTHTLGELGGGAVHLEFQALPEDRLGEVVAKRDEYEGIVREAIRNGIEEGEFRPMEPKVATLMMLGTLNWAALWWRPSGSRTPADLAREFGEVLLKGLLA